jgi:hypothetical protein
MEDFVPADICFADRRTQMDAGLSTELSHSSGNFSLSLGRIQLAIWHVGLRYACGSCSIAE